MKDIILIAALDRERCIGKDNQLMWHLPGDLKRFKEMTTGHTVIMGRKTYESIGRPLPNRRNIVITRNASLQIEGCEMANSLERALDMCGHEKQVFIIGGAQIYSQALPLATKMELTRVDKSFHGDAFFPEWDAQHWLLKHSESKNSETTGLDFDFFYEKWVLAPKPD